MPKDLKYYVGSDDRTVCGTKDNLENIVCYEECMNVSLILSIVNKSFKISFAFDITEHSYTL